MVEIVRILDPKLQRLKRKYPELTYSNLCMLQLHKVSKINICKMYGINLRTLEHFKKNHSQVLRKVKNW